MCLFYADDPVILVVGVQRCVRGIVHWTRTMGPRGANMLMGKPIKREIGVDLGWIGGRAYLPGMLAYIPGKKQLRTLAELAAAQQGTLTVEKYESLAGLLNHLVCLLAIPYFIMYGIYGVLDISRSLKLAGSDMAPVSNPRAKGALAALKQWEDTIRRRAGNSMFAAAFDAQLPADGVSITRIYQDAARKGTQYPAICGNLYQHVYILPLSGAWLELPS